MTEDLPIIITHNQFTVHAVSDMAAYTGFGVLDTMGDIWTTFIQIDLTHRSLEIQARGECMENYCIEETAAWLINIICGIEYTWNWTIPN